MAKIIAIKVKKIFFFFLIAIVSLLVLFAFYSNRSKFIEPKTTKYIKISLEDAVSIDELAGKYSSYESRESFTSELKRINDIENTAFISQKTLLVPIMESN